MPAPASYAMYIRNTEPQEVTERGYDPKTIAVLNLELRSDDKSGWTADRFFISADGIGNYYFISEGKGKSTVALWSHDPLGIEETGTGVIEFLNNHEQIYGILSEAPDGDIYLSRSSSVGGSILEPILLDEWKEAIADIDEITYLGYWMLKNIFTGEDMKIDRPGMAVAEIGDVRVKLSLKYGRIEIAKPPVTADPLVKLLAKRLNAKIFLGS